MRVPDRRTLEVRPLPSFGLATHLAKVLIGSLDDAEKGIEAQFNPKELSIERSVPWETHKRPRSDRPDLEFTGGDGRTLSLELLFDGYEAGLSVQDTVWALEELAAVRDPAGDEDELRPHQVAVVWGADSGGNLPAFRGVITSISTKYTMFLPGGAPVRATCAVKVKEAAALRSKKGR
jgi:Contractile injection system tube protein